MIEKLQNIIDKLQSIVDGLEDHTGFPDDDLESLDRVIDRLQDFHRRLCEDPGSVLGLSKMRSLILISLLNPLNENKNVKLLEIAKDLAALDKLTAKVEPKPNSDIIPPKPDIVIGG